MRINQNIKMSTKNIMENSLNRSMIDIKRMREELRKIRNTESKIRTSISNKIYESANNLLIKVLINKEFVISSLMKQ